MKDFSWGRKARLTRPIDFKRTRQEGKRLAGKQITIYLRPNEQPDSRLGVSFRRNLATTAVQRNRLKRLVRESFRLNRGRIAAGYDLVVVINAIPEKAEQQQKRIEEEFLCLVDKGRILK